MRCAAGVRIFGRQHDVGVQTLDDLAERGEACRLVERHVPELRHELSAIAERDDQRGAVAPSRVDHAGERIDRGSAGARHDDDAHGVDGERVDERRIAANGRWWRRSANVGKDLHADGEVGVGTLAQLDRAGAPRSCAAARRRAGRRSAMMTTDHTTATSDMNARNATVIRRMRGERRRHHRHVQIERRREHVGRAGRRTPCRCSAHASSATSGSIGVCAVRDHVARHADRGDENVVDRDRDAPHPVHEAADEGVHRLHREQHEHRRPDPVHRGDGAAGHDRRRREREQQSGEHAAAPRVPRLA